MRGLTLQYRNLSFDTFQYQRTKEVEEEEEEERKVDEEEGEDQQEK